MLFPFLPAPLVDADTRAALAEIFGSHPAFDVRFEDCGRFPGVLYLAPDPDTPFRLPRRRSSHAGRKPRRTAESTSPTRI